MTHTEDLFIVNETHAPDLVCQRRLTQVNGNNDVVRVDRLDIVGPVMIITEHRYRVNDDGTLGALCDTRTRLVVRGADDPEGNGSEYGITPLMVHDDETYKQYVFTAREEKPIVLVSDDSSELRDLRSVQAEVMRTLAEITRLHDETIKIRDAALRAASATRSARGG